MLFLFEIKKLFCVKALSVLMLVCIAITAVTAVSAAGSAEKCVVNAQQAREEYLQFASELKTQARAALRVRERTGDSYARSYYSAMIGAYERAENGICFKSGDVGGWDELLRFDVPFFAGITVSTMSRDS